MSWPEKIILDPELTWDCIGSSIKLELYVCAYDCWAEFELDFEPELTELDSGFT